MEGPSLVILREELQLFANQRVLKVTGNTRQPKDSLKGRVLEQIDTWGKVLFLIFSSPQSLSPIITKTHFLMFGSYRINNPRPDRFPRLELKFKSGIVSFYSCSIQFSAEKYRDAVDRRVDLMSDAWDISHVLDRMAVKNDTLICDLLLDQNVFAGSGNIIKNEVLFNARLNPLTRLSQIPQEDWPKLAMAVRAYCWNFYDWKKKFELRKHWQVYRQVKCPLCHTKLTREHLGKFLRKTFYCPRHQPSFTQKRMRKLRIHAVLPPKETSVLEPRLDH